MLIVFFSGCIGFFIYDAIRTYKVFIDINAKEFVFGGITGTIIRLFVYVAGGLIGIFANLDVLINLNELSWFEIDKSLVGCYLRAFAIGLAGPAGISKWNSSAGIEGKPINPKSTLNSNTLDSLEYKEICDNHLSIVLFSLRRLFLY